METLHFKGQYDPMFKIFSFLHAATFKEKNDNFKEHLKFIFYEAKKKRLWSTDGYRLHLVRLDMGNDDRAFRILIKKKNEIELIDLDKEEIGKIRKPNITIVLLNKKIIAIQEFSFTKRPEIAYIKIMRLFDKTILQQSFFNDLQLFSDTWRILIQDESDLNNGQYFKSENGLAVIMPLNIAKN